MIKNTKWIFAETNVDLQLMSEVLGISQTMARVMANRGIRSRNAAIGFLNATRANMRPFTDMTDADKAIACISAAIDAGDKITIYGDYDADGITSTVILYKVLTRLGANVSYYIPHRVTEGYGLNTSAIDQIAAGGTRLIVTLDSGITAMDEIAYGNALGIDTVVIDHHEPGEELPAAAAIVDPKRADCTFPFDGMCAAGLTYKLAHALCQHYAVPFLEQDEAMVLATVATVCDIVPLMDENRILVSSGLEILNANKLVNPGLGSLITMRGLLSKTINTFSTGYMIGPCINASGRLDTAAKAVELLLADANDKDRMQLTYDLMQLNEERRQITSDCVERLLESIAGNTDKVLVVVDKDTHESIAGIVAGRIKDATGRPTIVLTTGEAGMKGSGRSNPSYNMFDALYANRHLFIRFGGHSMAAGLTLLEENIDTLRQNLNAECILTDEDFFPQINIDCEIALENVTLPLAQELSKLGPFGSGNREPVFVTRNVFVDSVREIAEKNTIMFTFRCERGRKIKGIAFGMNDVYTNAVAGTDAERLTSGFYLDLAYAIDVNEYNGTISEQIRIKDIKRKN